MKLWLPIKKFQIIVEDQSSCAKRWNDKTVPQQFLKCDRTEDNNIVCYLSSSQFVQIKIQFKIHSELIIGIYI